MLLTAPRDTNYKWLLLLIILANATALFSGVMEPDGALYAYIAKQMAQHNDFVSLYNNTDWLDKPHFPFWITAISFKIFGIGAFAYKLPAFLFWLVGLSYLYRLGNAIYTKQTAMVAVLIYATALQAAIGLFDVRAEHYLTALTLAAIWHLYKLYQTNQIRYAFFAALFSACAVMTKGIFFITTIISGIGLLILVRKEWKQFANYRWYLYLMLTFLFILPELYCLYVQFDLHPEKIVYGHTDVSGLRFFFWDSQFGRFLNTGPIKGKGDPSFFIHTTLWAFLPWSFLLIASIYKLVKERKKWFQSLQWIIVGSAGFTFLIFSLSKFQLPHYIIILFPQFALLSAGFIVSRQATGAIRSFIMIQRLLIIVLLLAIVFLSAIYNLSYYPLIFIVAALFAASVLYASQSSDLISVMRLGVGFSLLLILFLNLCFYPSLLTYQSGIAAAKWMNRNENVKDVVMLKMQNPSFAFYANTKVKVSDTLLETVGTNTTPDYYFAPKKISDSLLQKGYPIQELHEFNDFHISKLTMPFLYAQLRPSQLDTTVLFTLKKSSVVEYSSR